MYCLLLCRKRRAAIPADGSVFRFGLSLLITLLSVSGVALSDPVFRDATEESGIDFIHFNGMSGEYYFVEMTGQGGALFDYDNDGDLDLYSVQGSMLGPGKTYADATFPPARVPPKDRLYRNEGNRGGVPRFVDVTDQAGLELTGYGMGAAVGDIDNDGWNDLFVTHYGRNRLLRNLGNGRFEDVSDRWGISGEVAWSTSAAFLDYDRDGWLDLYVANYVEYSVDDNKKCYAGTSRQDYCGPAAFKPQHDRLYHNRAGQGFQEVSDALLADYRAGPGLGVVAADLNGDGWQDLYVANDGRANQFWLNRQGKGFVDDALFAGAAVNRAGRAEASMGVDAGDFDNDGDEDLFVTHLMGETNTLYVNDGNGLFEDRTVFFGLASSSFPYTAFGTGWLDVENDGWLDLLVLNGAVLTVPGLAAAGDPYPLDQPNQLFLNQAGRRFRELDYAANSPLRVAEVSRGAALGDLDNDGDTDLVLFNSAGPTRVLLNQLGQGNNWIGLDLRGNHAERQLTGARVRVDRQGLPSLWRRARSDGSYCSANDPRILVGLGNHSGKVDIRIFWPDGRVSEHKGLLAGRYHQIGQPGQ